MEGWHGHGEDRLTFPGGFWKVTDRMWMGTGALGNGRRMGDGQGERGVWVKTRGWSYAAWRKGHQPDQVARAGTGAGVGRGSGPCQPSGRARSPP